MLVRAINAKSYFSPAWLCKTTKLVKYHKKVGAFKYHKQSGSISSSEKAPSIDLEALSMLYYFQPHINATFHL